MMNEIEKQALEAVARSVRLVRLPRVESDKARDIRLMIATRLAQLGIDIETAIKGAE
jgi:hypothetical protein